MTNSTDKDGSRPVVDKRISPERREKQDRREEIRFEGMEAVCPPQTPHPSD